MALFFGRGQQTRSLSDGSALGLEFQQPSFQLVEALSKPLPFHLLVITHRPRVARVCHGEEAHTEGQHHWRFGKLSTGGHRKGQGGQRTDASEDGPVAKDTKMAPHRPMGELSAHQTGNHHQRTPSQRCVLAFKTKRSEAHQKRPSHRCR